MTIKVKRTTAQRIRQLALTDDETYDSVINRALNILENALFYHRR